MILTATYSIYQINGNLRVKEPREQTARHLLFKPLGRVHRPITMNDPDTESEHLDSLYRLAFQDYGSLALWNMRPIENPSPADGLAITKALRTYGGMEGRRMAERIERLCSAPH